MLCRISGAGLDLTDRSRHTRLGRRYDVFAPPCTKVQAACSPPRRTGTAPTRVHRNWFPRAIRARAPADKKGSRAVSESAEGSVLTRGSSNSRRAALNSCFPARAPSCRESARPVAGPQSAASPALQSAASRAVIRAQSSSDGSSHHTARCARGGRRPRPRRAQHSAVLS